MEPATLETGNAISLLRTLGITLTEIGDRHAVMEVEVGDGRTATLMVLPDNGGDAGEAGATAAQNGDMENGSGAEPGGKGNSCEMGRGRPSGW
ncbi:MAG TPA: hypothetical protein VIU40_12955 [Geobacteraceae bacterium]